MAVRILPIKESWKATPKTTPAECKEISRIWKRVERKWHAKIEDVSAEMAMLAQIVKEVTFKGKRGSKPMHITLDWDSVMWAEDGTELSEFEIEKKIADQVDKMLAYLASESALTHD